MKNYKEFTFGWITFAFALPIQLLLTYLYINNVGDRPIGTNMYFLINLIFLTIYLLFYGLTTKITSDTIIVSFGIGLIRKRIKLERIKSLQVVQSPWYYGWGIRLIPNGILYNISGSDGVEIEFNDTNQIIRIGTKDSLILKNEIKKRLEIKI